MRWAEAPGMLLKKITSTRGSVSSKQNGTISYGTSSQANSSNEQMEPVIQESGKSQQFLPGIMLCVALAGHMQLFTSVLVMILIPLRRPFNGPSNALLLPVEYGGYG